MCINIKWFYKLRNKTSLLRKLDHGHIHKDTCTINVQYIN